MDTCPNCNASIKKGLLGSNALITNAQLTFINQVRPEKVEGVCEKCLPTALKDAMDLSQQEVEELKTRIKHELNQIPIVSSQSPNDWNYKTIGIITAQSVIGTGVATELSSSISDLFGQESDRMNRKIRTGEDLCFERLRRRCAETGGNAILAVDLDYNELGGLKGMIMVCATGTSVQLNPDTPDYWSTEYQRDLSRLNHLNNIRRPYQPVS